MPTRVRKQIYIDPIQNALIKRLAREAAVPEAEVIRQAIDRHIQALHAPRRDLRAWAAERDFILRLIQQGEVSGGRNWQREELHDR